MESIKHHGIPESVPLKDRRFETPSHVLLTVVSLLTRAVETMSVSIFLSATMLSIACAAAPSKSRTDRESVITCMQGSWFFGERRLLSAWAWLANGKNTKTLEKSLTDFQSRGLIAPLEVLAGDGRMLRGWRIRGISSTSAVLIAFGNLTTADYMTDRLLPLAQRIQSDIIIIDFRGYGRSVPGKGSFRALVQDEVEIGAALRGMGYSSIVGYGFSLGGIFLVNAVHGGLKLDNLIVDSIPATLTEYKCDSSVYPINVIDASCPNVTAVTSDNDVEVPPATQSPLLEHIQSPTCHGSVVHLRTAIHAFNDRPGTPGDVERVEAIVSLLSSK